MAVQHNRKGVNQVSDWIGVVTDCQTRVRGYLCNWCARESHGIGLGKTGHGIDAHKDRSCKTSAGLAQDRQLVTLLLQGSQSGPTKSYQQYYSLGAS